MALCVTKENVEPSKLKELENLEDLVLQQDTPVRVLHRRSNATREKTIHSMKVEPISETLFKLAVISSAGAYIKELVHGDFERTKPNLRTLLGVETDILALDVEEIYLDWPKMNQDTVKTTIT
ncbi:putative tRNA pseudouridine synthase Pus10 [Eurytemora carolleeae]|uniref:putative tRNA pseudouridine synthase Pus10 n=1 Tax=Eurytemora carolleeae TaxID=1294199 RepID=UPI000C790CDF|nr:putative tRNA pseudouridine synthase Pus10 [Eurytemora carolleeae]|eukprot:XP_023322844.1 putative tRNA pseudouridine synthase Pus10 [Eurytemora affinis]